MECEYLSLLCYHRLFLSMFIVQYFLLIGISYCVIYSSFFSACLICWFSCQYLPSDCLERLFCGCLLVDEIISTKTGSALSYSAVQWIAAALHNLTCKLCSAAVIDWSAAKFLCKWAWHLKIAFATNFHQLNLNMQSCPLHCSLTPLLQ